MCVNSEIKKINPFPCHLKLPMSLLTEHSSQVSFIVKYSIHARHTAQMKLHFTHFCYHQSFHLCDKLRFSLSSLQHKLASPIDRVGPLHFYFCDKSQTYQQAPLMLTCLSLVSDHRSQQSSKNIMMLPVVRKYFGFCEFNAALIVVKYSSPKSTSGSKS